MDLKQYKYLVVCGDSFTQGHVMGEQASWAYWTAKKLGLELINLAIGGMANDWIYSKPILWFNQNKDKIKESICMVAWTDFGRQHTIYQPVVSTENDERWITNIHPGDLSETPPFDINSTDNIPNALKYMHKNREVLKPYFGSIIDALYKTVNSQMILREYLESVNIPFCFFDAVTYNKFTLDFENKIIKMINPTSSELNIDFLIDHNMDSCSDLLNQNISDYMFDEHYFDFEGQSIWGCYPKWENGSEKYEKGNFGHTNIEGAKVFADMIVSKFKNLYSIV